MAHYGGSVGHVWSQSRLLGRGTSGYIYLGWDKKSAKKCAVKEFKATASKHALREIEVIKDLKHPHIVRVVGIETNTRTGEHVLIMENCEGGSLYSKLREPEYYFGLPEEDLLRLITQISAALAYLYKRHVIHRDVKPGNIMCTIGPSGWTEYKLSDFGTAVVLRSGAGYAQSTQSSQCEEFSTLQGTEEYMHPQMYRDLADKNIHTSNGYSTKADLYSMGVTIYQAATGSLPFTVPGGRKDKPAMAQLVTQKPKGTISGTMKSSDEPKWESELPATCRLSRSLKTLLEKILASVMYHDIEQAWTFKKYFGTVDHLESCVVIHVFAVMSCTHHRIYLEGTSRMIHLQEAIAQLEDVPVQDQVLLYLDCVLRDVIPQDQPLHLYRNTSPEDPIIVLRESTMPNLRTSEIMPPTPNVPTLPEGVDLDKDFSMGREIAAIVHFIHREVKVVQLSYALLGKAVLAYGLPVSQKISFRKQLVLKLSCLWDETCVKFRRGRAFVDLFWPPADETDKSTDSSNSSDAHAPRSGRKAIAAPPTMSSRQHDPVPNGNTERPSWQAAEGDPKELTLAVKKHCPANGLLKIVKELEKWSLDGTSPPKRLTEFELRKNNGMVYGLWEPASVLWSDIVSSPPVDWERKVFAFLHDAIIRLSELKTNQQKKILDKNEKQIHIVERYHLRKAACDVVAFLKNVCVSTLKEYHKKCIMQLNKLNDDKRDMDELEILAMQREEHRLKVSTKYDVEYAKFIQGLPHVAHGNPSELFKHMTSSCRAICKKIDSNSEKGDSMMEQKEGRQRLCDGYSQCAELSPLPSPTKFRERRNDTGYCTETHRRLGEQRRFRAGAPTNTIPDI